MFDSFPAPELVCSTSAPRRSPACSSYFSPHIPVTCSTYGKASGTEASVQCDGGIMIIIHSCVCSWDVQL